MIKKQDIFAAHQSHPSCHAATITMTASGNLLAAWYAGSYETASDQSVFIARGSASSDGWTWSAPQRLPSEEGKPDGNPVLFTDPSGKIWLFYVTLYGRGWKSAILKVCWSADEGETWSHPLVLSAVAGVMPRTKPVILCSGSWLLPLYDERSYAPLFWRSDDQGKTWREVARLAPNPPMIQPATVLLSDGRLLAYLRTSVGWVYRITSDDEGSSWSQPQRTDLSNPDSAVDLARTLDGRLVLACNPYRDRRTPLTVAFSPTEAEHWQVFRDLEVGDGEFSYPCLLADPSGFVHCVYTFKRQTIRHAVFDRQWLCGGP
ncbi:MAG: exo-alpha-sialidase [Armatimonadetes bacterium]|nr:exo-alpha-sialidase [Armatimonadota bacterium]MDW8120739.1 sialidase family protein [Armatimonadota bacterium]